MSQEVINQAAQECDIAARTDRGVIIRYCCRACKAWIDYNQFGIIVSFCFRYPLETTGVGLGSITAHHNNYISVFYIYPMIGHGATTECSGKTCHCGGVSDSGLVVEREYPQASYHFMGKIAGFIAGGRSRQEAGGQPTIHS